MLIEAYFQEIRHIIETHPSIFLTDVTYDKRGAHEGFIRGELVFVDDSILHFREFIDTETIVERLIYVYQYMGPNKNLVFRYDNSGHHRNLGLSTYPHHKHEGSESNIAASSSPTLLEILIEIENLYIIPL